MSLFGDLNISEFATALRSAVASFGHVDPPHGFDSLTMPELGINQQHGTTYTSRSGRGKAIVVQQDSELIVAFRGTDHLNDVKDYDNISFARNYYKQFGSLLDHVADYAKDNDLHVTFTGISLGGAVVNIIADHADKLWGKVFSDADFVGIASPYLSHNRKADIYNFGFGNDIVYHVAPGAWTTGSRSMAATHVFLYENHQYLKTDNLSDRVSAHNTNNYADAVKALSEITLDDGKMLVDTLNHNSYMLFDSTREIVRAGRLKHPGDTPLTIIGEDRADRLYGASAHNHGSKIEWFFGRGGNDNIMARDGNDLLYGGAGNDILQGGKGVDYSSGGGGNDRITLENHRDTANGGAGNDLFIVSDILPRNNNGSLAPTGNLAARLFIEDFARGSDTLDLRRVDGNLERKGDQPLHFAGYERYDNSDGLNALEKGYVVDTTPGSVTIFADQSGNTHVLINRDHDRTAEMDIVLHGDVGNIIHDLLL